MANTALAAPSFSTALGLPPALETSAVHLAAGHFDTAFEALGKAPVDPLQKVLRAWSGRRALRVDAESLPDFPKATGWSGVINAALQKDVGIDVRLPPLPPQATAAQKELYSAFSALYPSVHFCDPPKGEEPRVLAAAVARFEAAGLPGFAAQAEVRRARALPKSDPQREKAAAYTFFLLKKPGAGHARRAVLDLMLVGTPPPFTQEIANKAALARILQIEADIKWDLKSQNLERMAERITGLTLPVVGRQPQRTAEVVRLAVAGDQTRAAVVVQALFSGPFAIELISNFQGAMMLLHTLSSHALQPFAQMDPAKMKPELRVAMAVPFMVEAALYQMLRGDGASAQQAGAKAELFISEAWSLKARADALKNPKTEGNLAAWAPWIRLALSAETIGLMLVHGNSAAAETLGKEMVDFVAQILNTEFSRHKIKGLKAHVAALARLGKAMIHWGFVSDKAATVAVRKAVKAVPLTTQKGTLTTQRWLILFSVALHNAAWIVDAGHPKMLEPVTTAMDDLVAQWTPESQLARVALLVALTAQHGLPSLQGLLKSENLANDMASFPQVKNAFNYLKAQLHKDFPPENLVETLRSDRPERVILEHFVGLLEAGPAVFSSEEKIYKVLTQTNNRLLDHVREHPGDTRDLLTLGQAAFLGAQGKSRLAANIALGAAQHKSGPAFRGYSVIWHALSARWLAEAKDWAGADQAAQTALKSCPPVAAEIGIARGYYLEKQGELSASADQFKQARASGGMTHSPQFVLKVHDNNAIVNFSLHAELIGTLLGRMSGQFNLGLGAEEFAKSVRDIHWTFNPSSTPAETVLTALVIETWLAFERGDTALIKANTVALKAVLTQQQRPRSSIALVWLAVYAHLHGDPLGDLLLTHLRTEDPREWRTPGGKEGVCDAKAPSGAQTVFQELWCHAPVVLTPDWDVAAEKAFSEYAIAVVAKQPETEKRAVLLKLRPQMSTK